jgi:hypothetical protein
LQGDDLTATTTRAAVPLPAVYQPEAPRKITSEEKEFEAFKTLRQERGKARYEGKRKAAAAKVGDRLMPLPSMHDADSLCRRTRRRQRRRSRCAFACSFILLFLHRLARFPSMYSSKLWASHDRVMHYGSHASISILRALALVILNAREWYYVHL